MTLNQYGPEDNHGWFILVVTTLIVSILLAMADIARGDERRTDYTATMRRQTETRMLFTRLDCWETCPPCRKLESYLAEIGVTISVTKTDKQHVSEYPVAHYVTSGGVPVQESGLDAIVGRLKAGGLRFSGPPNKPTLEVRMWSGK